MVAFNGRVVVLGLRIAQGILAVLVLALTAYVADWWRRYYHAGSPPQVNFLVFDSVWTVLALIYLIVVPWRFSDTIAHHKFAILAVEALTALFWFAGFIALAVFLSDRVCYGRVCSAVKAAAAFGAFEWVLFSVTTGMAIMHVFRTRDRPTSSDKADPNLNVQQGT